MDIDKLKSANKTVGFRQVIKSLNANTVNEIILAADSEEDFKQKVKRAAEINGVPVTETSTRAQLAKVCGIDTNVAVVGIFK